jgi:hypothetical protein
MDIDRETGPGALWIHADEYGEPEHVTRFVLRCAEAFDLKGAWGFCWSLICSKPCIEAFGGGGLFLDLAMRETVASIDCADWLAHQLTDPGEFAEQRQQEATKENGPQPEWKGIDLPPPARRKGPALHARGVAAPLPRADGMRGGEVFSP